MTKKLRTSKPKKGQPVPAFHREDTIRTFIRLHNAIDIFQKENFCPPSHLEICRMKDSDGKPMFSPSTSVIGYYMESMVRLGMVKRAPRKARAIHLCPRDEWDELVQKIAEKMEMEKIS